VGDGACIGAKAGVSKNVRPGQTVTGYPARDLMNIRRVEAIQQRLPEMKKELKRLRNEIEELKRIKDNG
jgi:UDP-3-O-[3-hydroxymyristoyl] glucosamine N-acyltransferase